MKDHVRKAMERALVDIDGQLWGKTYVPDEFVEKFADYLLQIKELSDEEIDKIIKQHDWYSKSWVDMVRSIESAILKKASEK
jgi:hypothetical protein